MRFPLFVSFAATALTMVACSAAPSPEPAETSGEAWTLPPLCVASPAAQCSEHALIRGYNVGAALSGYVIHTAGGACPSVPTAHGMFVAINWSRVAPAEFANFDFLWPNQTPADFAQFLTWEIPTIAPGAQIPASPPFCVYVWQGRSAWRSEATDGASTCGLGAQAADGRVDALCMIEAVSPAGNGCPNCPPAR